MKHISDSAFLDMRPNPDSVIGIRVKDGEFYFLAWMVDSENYRIEGALNPKTCQLDRHALIATGDIYEAIRCTDGHDSLVPLCSPDEDGNTTQSEYEFFLDLIKPHDESNPDDHDILILTETELSSFADLLKDGDYIFIMTE